MTSQDGEDEECAFSDTDEKLDEAHYFLHEMLNKYHDPAPFRYSLNAFLQSLRSVTLYLQREGRAEFENFGTWYANQQDAMKADLLLRRFVEGRNIVAHKRQLLASCRIEAGLFRGNVCKLALDVQVDPRNGSVSLLEMAKTFPFIDPEHHAIGEQAGVRRTWIFPDLDAESEACNVCHVAWARIHRIVANAHNELMPGRRTTIDVPEVSDVHDVNEYNLLLETDLDPSIAKDWGWT